MADSRFNNHQLSESHIFNNNQQQQQQPTFLSIPMTRERPIFVGNNSLRSIRQTNQWSCDNGWRNEEQHSSQRSIRGHHFVTSQGERRVWNVTKVRPLPIYYPLEASSIAVSGVAPQEISSRISQFLRINSICASYHADRVDCLTCDLLKFVVQLWKGSDDSTVIVEVQRRQGCAILMRRVRSGLFRTIRSDQPITTPEATTDRTPSQKLRNYMDATIESRRKQHEAKRKICSERCIDSLQIAENLMESHSMDQNKLGMESLSVLTNPAIVKPSDALTVSKMLLLGEGEHGVLLRDCFVSYFKGIELDSDEHGMGEYDYDSDDDDEDEMHYAKGEYFGAMHHLALGVLSNALSVLAKDKDEHSLGRTNTNSSVDTARSSFWKSIVDALVYNIEVVDQRPQEAALSAKCIFLLMSLSPALQHGSIVQDRLVPGLIQANEFGRAQHLLLETESRNLISRLVQTQ